MTLELFTKQKTLLVLQQYIAHESQAPSRNGIVILLRNLILKRFYLVKINSLEEDR